MDVDYGEKKKNKTWKVLIKIPKGLPLRNEKTKVFPGLS